MRNINSNDRSDIRKRKEQHLKKLYGIRGSEAYVVILSFLENELEIVKEQMIDTEHDALIRMQGSAVMLRNIIRNLREARRPE